MSKKKLNATSMIEALGGPIEKAAKKLTSSKKLGKSFEQFMDEVDPMALGMFVHSVMRSVAKLAIDTVESSEFKNVTNTKNGKVVRKEIQEFVAQAFGQKAKKRPVRKAK